MEHRVIVIDEKYDAKWNYMRGYREEKIKLMCLLERREEYRDLKRISDEAGMPPKGAMPSDTTGNSAARLVDTLDRLNDEIANTVEMLNKITAYIDSCNGATDRLVLTMKFIRGKNVDEIAYAVTEKTGRMTSRSTLKKRIKRIVMDMPMPT